MTQSLHEKAIKILKANDRGGYTVPTAGLYPYQWNWDSAFVALGFATFDSDRAWREVETLFEAQWADGFVPHIVFRVDDPSYFPGPSVWKTGKTPETSGITQPPVAASIVRWMLEAGGEEQRAAALYPKLLAWHRWFHRYRDPLGKGLVMCMHPWESGRDNSPEWDQPSAAVDTSSVEPYQRRDLALIDHDMRPSTDEYDRYIAILQHGRDSNWNHTAIAETGPFRVYDVGMTMILLRANRDLLQLARQFGTPDERAELQEQIALSESNMDYLWNDQLGAYCSRNAITGASSGMVTSASFLAFYAHIGDGDRRNALMENFKRISSKVRYTLPSFDPDRPEFNPILYWRGPVWAIVNKMAALGFSECGLYDAAERVFNDTTQLIEKAGFYESYSPIDGVGAGGGDFSWTAAMWLHLTEDDQTARSLSGVA